MVAVLVELLWFCGPLVPPLPKLLLLWKLVLPEKPLPPKLLPPKPSLSALFLLKVTSRF